MPATGQPDPNGRAAKRHRTIPVHRQAVYAGILMLAVLGLAELLSRLIVTAVPNARWNYHANLVQTIGFGGLNEILEPDPERFWRVRPGLSGVRLSGRIADSGPISFTVSTDAQGYRRMPEVPDPRGSVLFLGDSCTFGVGVEDDQTFAAVLQDRIPGVRCVNAGAPGYSAYQGRVTLERMTLESPPDVVVVSFMFNDDSGWDGLSDAEHAEALGSPLARLTRRSRLLSLLASLGPTGGDSPSRARSRRPRLTDDEYAEELRRIVRHCKDIGSDPVFLVWPMVWQMTGSQRIGKQETMRQVAVQEGVPLVDLVPMFRTRGSTTLFADVIHASPEGNRLVAEALEPLVRGLLRTRPLPGNREAADRSPAR